MNVSIRALIEEQDFQDAWSDALRGQLAIGHFDVLFECYECGHVWSARDDTQHCPECGGIDIETARGGIQ